MKVDNDNIFIGIVTSINNTGTSTGVKRIQISVSHSTCAKGNTKYSPRACAPLRHFRVCTCNVDIRYNYNYNYNW